MGENLRQDQAPSTAEPRWPAALALLVIGGLYRVLPASLAVIPRWYLLLLTVTLLALTFMAHRSSRHRLSQALDYLLGAIITAAMVGALALLLITLPAKPQTSEELLRSTANLWTINILVFAWWYWRLDGRRPDGRDQRSEHSRGKFLFPEAALGQEARLASGQQNWSPNFMDYLFIAFNSSTAFSPSGAIVLSRWIKLLMMLQITISLIIIAVLVSRAVGLL